MSKSPALVLRLSLSLLGFLVLPGWFPQAIAQDIHVVAGTYGGNCKAPPGNVTNHLAAACNGRSDCSYKVDYTVIGDPAAGCGKDYVAEWRCGRSSEVHRVKADPEAGFGSVITLGCPR